MAAILIRLLVLIAVALMPAGMSAPAAAQPAAVASASGHCAGHDQPEQAPATMDMECLACAALPAANAPAAAERALPSAPRLLALVSESRGIILEIATPPPKRV